MLTAHDTARLLVTSFPELSPRISAARRYGFYQPLDQFSVYTRQALEMRQLTRLGQCFAVAEQLLYRGDDYLACAIETVYLPGLHLDDAPGEAALARQLMPPRLYRAYLHQQADILP